MTYNLRRLLSGMKEAFARQMRKDLKSGDTKALDEHAAPYQECAIAELHAYEDDKVRKAGL